MNNFVLYHGGQMIGEYQTMHSVCGACQICEMLGYSNLVICRVEDGKIWDWN